MWCRVRRSAVTWRKSGAIFAKRRPAACRMMNPAPSTPPPPYPPPLAGEGRVGVAALARTRIFPLALGIGALAAAILSVEVLIRIGVINRFIVPLPSQIALAFDRVIVEEDIAERFRLTFFEAFTAGAMITVIGVSLGFLLFRIDILRQATETWVAALASAPTVLMYPLFLVIFGRSAWTIIMMGFVAGLPPVILKTIEGLSGTRGGLINVGRNLKLTSPQMFIKILFPSPLPTIFFGLRPLPMFISLT